ncbi:MAG: hypothetical protein WC807_07595 [Hyphomicrobium sp.]
MARLAVALALTLMTAARAVRAEDWIPIVATTAGEEVATRVATPGPLPQWVSPRLLNATPAAVSPQLVIPVPQAGSSNIVTGALPDRVVSEERPAERARAADQLDVALETPQPNAAKGGAGAGASAKPEAQPIPVTRPAIPVAAPTPAAVRPAAASNPKSPGPATAAAKPTSSVAPVAEPAPSTASSGESNGLQTKPKPMEALPPEATSAQQYCFNTAESASDARFAWQAKKITELEAELEKRVQLLQAKTEEYKSWLARRDEFARKAHEKLVAFYAKMKPDAAALQMTVMDEETAAALLTKLEPKVASLILGEIEPTRAAKITAIISGAAKTPPDRRQKGATAAPPPGNGAPKPPGATRAGSPAAAGSRS